MKRILLILFLFTGFFSKAQTKITSLQEVLLMAEKNSATFMTAYHQEHLARLTTQASYYNSFNPRLPISASITDNISLPVTIIPSQFFDKNAPSTSMSQVRMGVQYQSAFNIAPQFEVINFGGLAKIRSAKTNEELTSANLLLSKKSIFDQINSCYHNILSFQAQIKVLKKNKEKGDSLLFITKQKYENGIVRKQDVNDAEINVLSMNDKVQQAEISLEQQYLTLRMLCDTDEVMNVIEQMSDKNINNIYKSESTLTERASMLQVNFARAEYRFSLMQNLPTITFVSSINFQNNSDKRFWDGDKTWINSTFWGLRLNWDFPTNVNKITVQKTNAINLKIAEINAKHASLQSKVQNEIMEKDLEKSKQQYKNSLDIYRLKQDSFTKSLNQFDANILPIDKLLLAHNDLLLSELNTATQLATILFNQSKIDINNRFK